MKICIYPLSVFLLPLFWSHSYWPTSTGRNWHWCFFLKKERQQKSDNLQYNTLVCWFARTNDSSTKRLMFQALFFIHNFLKNSLQKSFHFFLIHLQKWKQRVLSALSLKKKNGWNIRCLVDEPFVPSTQWASVLYWRLWDFKIGF